MPDDTALLLERHFDTAFAAPEGVQKLRELILTLAMQGKLVPQDPTDPPASELLKEIEAEKQRLVEEGKIKKVNPLPEIRPEEVPYQLPAGWKWVQLGDITEIVRGITFPSSAKSKDPLPGRIACLRTSNVQYEIEWNDLLYIDRSYIKKDAQLICEDDIVMSMANSRELVGKVAIIKNALKNESTFGGFLGVIRTYKVLPYFTLNLLKSDYARRTLVSSASQTTNIANISIGKLNPFLVPLPPLPEQRRIVAKIDELMARCDELEKLRAQRDQQRITVHAAAISRLLATASSPAAPAHQKDSDFGEAWQFITHHFGDLYTVKENVAELRKAILQLAVMGKLAPQDPNDPPASELLKAIEAEKQRLVKAGKLKKQKPLPKIKLEELPYELPPSWIWCRIWDVAQLITSGSRDWAKYYADDGAIFITMGNLSRGDYHLRMDKIRYVNPLEDGEGTRTKLEENDLLISITGDVGNLGLIPKDFGEAYINQHTCLLRFMPICHNRYFPEFLRSPWAKEQFDGPQRGIKNSFRLGDVGSILIPLPPLPEQHRIVAKIDQLMALCDRLEANIATATHQQTKLLHALMAGV